MISGIPVCDLVVTCFQWPPCVCTLVDHLMDGVHVHVFQYHQWCTCERARVKGD